MTHLKQEYEMIKFAIENGFTNISKFEQSNGEVSYTGSFGTFVVNEEDSYIIDAVILVESSKLVSNEQKEENTNGEMEIRNHEKDSKVMSDMVSVEELDLSNKEKEVLRAIIDNSYEYGLGMNSSELNCSIKGKSMSGVISSLTKKGYVEPYLNDMGVGYGEFFNLTEKWFDILVGE